MLRHVNAGNAGPFTLDGTRSYIVGERQVALIDPGPDVEDHVRALSHALTEATSLTILLTHGHADHSGCAQRMASDFGAPLRGAGPGALPLKNGEEVPTDAGAIRALITPGHTADHLCFYWPTGRALFVGDVLLGEGQTTWVAEYPGCVADYLNTLDVLDGLDLEVIYPAHGPRIQEPGRVIQGFRNHRLARIEQVAALLEEYPAADAHGLLASVYGDKLPTGLEGPATQSIDAILDYLKESAR